MRGEFTVDGSFRATSFRNWIAMQIARLSCLTYTEYIYKFYNAYENWEE